MSGADQIVINTRERASSGDINDLQSLKDRTFLETMQRIFSYRLAQTGNPAFETAGRSIVAGGLQASPSGTDIAISSGVLFQDSATLTPVPGALDTSYRWASLRSPLVVSNPAPGADTWYLLEVQMDDIVALNVARDIWDTGLGAFVSTLVDKRTERTIAAQLVAGSATDLPVPSGGDWVPIAGILVPTGGGAIPAANFIDLRPLPQDMDQSAYRYVASQGHRLVGNIQTLGDTDDTTKQVVFAAEAFSPMGVRLWFETDQNGILLYGASLGAAYSDGGGSPNVSGAVNYLYLVPIRHLGGAAFPARNAYAWRGGDFANINGNCLLIHSTTAPGADGEIYPNAFTLPAPFSNYTINAGTAAVCIGALGNEGANDDRVQQGMDGVNTQRLNATDAITNFSDSFTPTGGGTPDAISVPGVPACAKLCHYRLSWVRNGAGTAGQVVDIEPSGGGLPYHSFADNWTNPGDRDFTMPPGAFSVAFSGAAVPSSAIILLTGWSL